MNKLYVIFFSGLICLTGCGQHDYKAEADKAVYDAIDSKWADEFGTKANYKISDTAAGEDDIQIEDQQITGVLALSDAVAMATANNREYQTQKEVLYTTALDLRLARHVFEPQPFGGGGILYGKEGSDEQIAASGSVGFERMFTSGARFTSSLTAAWIEILSGNPKSGLRTLLNATITQPLLRGSNSEIVMETLTQADRNTLYQIRSFNRFRKSFIVSIISQYYRVGQQYDRMKNAETNYLILSHVYERAEKLSKGGRLPRFELDQANQDILDAQDQYSQAQRDYHQALDDSKISLSLPVTARITLDEDEIKGLDVYNGDLAYGKMDRHADNELLELIQRDVLESEQEQYDEDYYEQLQTALVTDDPNDRKWIGDNEAVFFDEDITKTVLALRLDLANSKDRIDDAQRKINVALDNLRAGLNLTAGTDITSGDSTKVGLWDVDENSIDLGLELDLPLDRMAEANVYRKSMIILTQRQRGFFNVLAREGRQAVRSKSLLRR